MIIKIGLNNLNHINLKNLDDLVKYSKIINEYFSSFFDEHYELIFLFGKDLFKIFFKIDNLINELGQERNETKIKLLNIIYHLSTCFKSLYGYLFLIDKIQFLKLEQFYSVDSIMDCIVKVNYLMIKQIGTPNDSKNLYTELADKNFTLVDTSACFADKYLIFFYNPKFGLLKVHKLNQKIN